MKDILDDIESCECHFCFCPENKLKLFFSAVELALAYTFSPYMPHIHIYTFIVFPLNWTNIFNKLQIFIAATKFCDGLNLNFIPIKYQFNNLNII